MSLTYALNDNIDFWFNEHCRLNIEAINDKAKMYNINKGDYTFDDICQTHCTERSDNLLDITQLLLHLRSCFAIVKDRYFLKQEQDCDGSTYIEELTFEQLCRKLQPYHPFVNDNDRITFMHVIVKYSHLFVYRKLKSLQNKEDINRECVNVVNTGSGSNARLRCSCGCGAVCPPPCCPCPGTACVAGGKC